MNLFLKMKIRNQTTTKRNLSSLSKVNQKMIQALILIHSQLKMTQVKVAMITNHVSILIQLYTKSLIKEMI